MKFTIQKPGFITALALLICTTAFAQQFRIVGYLPSYRWSYVNFIDYDNLTHICYSFANPDAAGNFSYSQNLTTLLANAKAKNVKVIASIGGAGVSATQKTAYKNLTKANERAGFINKLMNYLREAGVDGVDVDLEGELVQMSTYSDFVVQLADSIHAENMTISAATASWTNSSMSQASVDALDFINLMSYDQTGSWQPNNPGPHSTYNQSVADVNYWKNTRNQNMDKIVLGVPFYGYEFKNDNTAGALTWCEIAGLYPNDRDKDQATTANGTVYYNGTTTIEKKTQYMLDQRGGGIMIWELGQDCFGANSLFDLIISTRNNVLSNQEVEANNFLVYPNPVQDLLNISSELNEFTVEIIDLTGKVVYEAKNKFQLNVSNLLSGVYLIKITSENGQKTSRFIKQ